MVCIRCQMVVKSELERLGIQYTYVHIGEVNTIEEIPGDKLNQLDIALRKSGYPHMLPISSGLINGQKC